MPAIPELGNITCKNDSSRLALAMKQGLVKDRDGVRKGRKERQHIGKERKSRGRKKDSWAVLVRVSREDEGWPSMTTEITVSTCIKCPPLISTCGHSTAL